MHDICPTDPDLLRLPGLYRSWELGQLFGSGVRYLIEEAEETADGAPLFAVYAGDVPPSAGETPR